MCASGFVELRKIKVGDDRAPVGEQLREQDWTVKTVRVEHDEVGSSGHADEGLASGFDQAPGPGHGYKVAPRIEHVSVPVGEERK